MSVNPVARRLATASLAVLLTVAAILAPPPIVEPSAVHAGDPGTASFALPTEDELALAAGTQIAVDPGPPPDPAAPGTSVDDIYAAVEAYAPEDWEIASLAATLGDPEAAFRFVRDSIRYEPYRGVLRGAAGTLAARAGNGHDRSLLLAALTAEMGFPTRFALARLDDATADSLLDRSLLGPVAPLPTATELALAPLDAASIVGRARRDLALLRTALVDRIPSLYGADRAAVLPDAAAHAWLQIERDGLWIDLDPTLADAEPRQTLAPAAQTFDVLPDTERQAVTVRVHAETLESDGYAYDTVVLQHRLDAADAADSDIFVYFQPQGSGSLLSPVDSLAGATAYVPLLMVDGVVIEGTAFPVPTSGGLGGFGGFGGATGPELLSLRLSLMREMPDAEPREAVRFLVDREPAAMRTSGVVDPAGLLSMEEGAGGIDPFAWVHHLMISTGGSSPLVHATERGLAATFVTTELIDDIPTGYPLSDLLWPLAVADRGLVVASERAIVPGMDVEGEVHTVIGRPRLYLVSVGPDPRETSTVAFQIDLLVDGIGLVASRDSPKTVSVDRQLWYGALQTALETESGMRLARVFDRSTLELTGVSLAMDQPLSVLQGADVPKLPDGVSRMLTGGLSAGLLAVVPGEPATAEVWWTVGPNGATRSVLAPGLGGWEIFPGTGNASIYHFPKPPPPPPAPPPRVPVHHFPKKVKPSTSSCRNRGPEYGILVGCISIPMVWVAAAAGATLGALVVAAVYWLLG